MAKSKKKKSKRKNPKNAIAKRKKNVSAGGVVAIVLGTLALVGLGVGYAVVKGFKKIAKDMGDDLKKLEDETKRQMGGDTVEPAVTRTVVEKKTGPNPMDTVAKWTLARNRPNVFVLTGEMDKNRPAVKDVISLLKTAQKEMPAAEAFDITILLQKNTELGFAMGAVFKRSSVDPSTWDLEGPSKDTAWQKGAKEAEILDVADKLVGAVEGRTSIEPVHSLSAADQAAILDGSAKASDLLGLGD